MRFEEGLKAVEALRVLGEEAVAGAFRGVAGEEEGGLEPAAEVSAEVADGPIGAEEDAVPAEAFDDVIDEGAEIGGGPFFAVAVGGDAGDFAGGVGELGEAADVVAPGIESLVFDVGDAAVIEDEGDIGALLDQCRGDGELAREDAEIEGEGVRGQEADVLGEERALGNLVGDDVEDTSNSAQLREFQEFGEVLGKIGALGPRAGDDAGNERIFIGEVLDMPGFVEGVGFVHVAFDEEGLDDARALGGGEVIGKREGAV